MATPGALQEFPEKPLALAPDPVELVLVLREHPALGYAAVTEAIQPVGSPFEGCSALDRPSRRDDEPMLVVDQYVVHGDLERSLGKLASSPDVLHDLIDPSVFAGDRVPAGDVPDDILGNSSARARSSRAERASYSLRKSASFGCIPDDPIWITSVGW